MIDPLVSTTREARRQALFVAGLALISGLAMVFVLFRSQSLVDTKFDPYFFGAMGKSVAHGDGLLPFGTLIKRRAPLYPLMIGALYWLFGEAPRLVLVVQCLLHAGTCLLVFDLGRRVFSPRAGIIAGVICALHPMLTRYVADLHLETLFTFLITLTLWMTERFRSRPSWTNAILFGAVAGLATLTKAVVIIYPALFAIGMMITALRKKDPRAFPLGPFIAAAAAMVLVISPWTVRNYRVTGHFVPVSSGFSDAFLRGLVFSRPEFATLQKPPYTDAENEVNAWFRQLALNAGTVWEREDWETDQLLNQEMKRQIAAHPGEVVRKSIVGLFTFWYEMTSLSNSLLAGGLALVIWAFAIVGLRRGHAERKPVWLFLLPPIYLNLLLAGLLALGRYSAPVLPALIIVAAYGIDVLLSRREAVRA